MSVRNEFSTKYHGSFCSGGFGREIRGSGRSGRVIYCLWAKNSMVTVGEQDGNLIKKVVSEISLK